MGSQLRLSDTAMTETRYDRHDYDRHDWEAEELGLHHCSQCNVWVIERDVHDTMWHRRGSTDE